ncbi:Hypothetical predicted protein [Olea europaea subsp. europaea]|uniref:Phospholipid scramblase n=1 Tax=Olea europaea subsp. europaea TaxID=158383 RepID=A0A8S0Q895_OLEEU|nr:Hypothetical predicted protein [Olea europaea subsp. europaea]
MSQQQPPPVGMTFQQQPPYYPGYPSQGQQSGYPPQQPQQQYYPNQPFPPPIQQQPGQHYSQPMVGSGWLQRNFQGYLQNATSFHVKQKVELVEAILGWETGNQYSVSDQAGNKVFYVGEESNLCLRQLCNARRAFTLTVKDVQGANVLIMDRSLDCSCCFGCCCPDKLTVSTSNGQLLGTVEEEFHILNPSFSVKNAAGSTVLRVEGPMCAMSCLGGSVVFQVLNMSGVSVGTISKEWGGFVRELFTDADSFHMSFPVDLDPAIKAVCMGALFLIDYEYFESGTTDKNQGGRRLFS